MYISSSKTYTDVAQRFYFYKKEFVHEYIHFLDEVRQKPTYKPVYSSQYDTALGFNYKDYFNSAKEFNAYYTEGLNFIHDATLALAKGKRQDIWFKWYPDFETFLKSKSQSFDQEFIKALNTKNLKRMTNRLYNYYMWVCDKWKNYNPNR